MILRKKLVWQPHPMFTPLAFVTAWAVILVAVYLVV